MVNNCIRKGVALLGGVMILANTVLPSSIVMAGEDYTEGCFTYADTAKTVIKQYSSDESCPREVVIPDTVIEIGDRALHTKGLVSITIPNSVIKIGEFAIANNDTLTSVEIPDSVVEIGRNAFYRNKLQSVKLPNALTKIADGAFADNELTSVAIPNSVKEIDYEAFTRNKIDSLTLPTGLIKIGKDAFSHNQLTSLDIPSSVTQIWEWAFFDNQISSLTIPESVTLIGQAAFNKNQLPDDMAFIYKRKNDGSEDTSVVVSYGGANRKNLVIPDFVKKIGPVAFAQHQLTSIEIPNSVEEIGMGAFAGNKLTSVNLPDSITRIESSAFSNNELTSIKIPNSVKWIENATFSNNKLSFIIFPTSLEGIWSEAFKNNELTSVDIPDSVTQIGKEAFWGNVLTLLTIPDSVTEIGVRAFGTNNEEGDGLIQIPLVSFKNATKFWQEKYLGYELNNVNQNDVFKNTKKFLSAIGLRLSDEPTSEEVPVNVHLVLPPSISPEELNDLAPDVEAYVSCQLAPIQTMCAGGEINCPANCINKSESFAWVKFNSSMEAGEFGMYNLKIAYPTNEAFLPLKLRASFTYKGENYLSNEISRANGLGGPNYYFDIQLPDQDSVVVHYDPQYQLSANDFSAYMYSQPRMEPNDKTIQQLESPQREEYEFVGWGLTPNDPQAGTEELKQKTLESFGKKNVTLYAVWRETPQLIAKKEKMRELMSKVKLIFNNEELPLDEVKEIKYLSSDFSSLALSNPETEEDRQNWPLDMCELIGEDGLPYNRHGKPAVDNGEQGPNNPIYFAGCHGLFHGAIAFGSFPQQEYVYKLRMRYDLGIKEYRVKFIGETVTLTLKDGETELGKQTVLSGTAAEKPADPKKENFTFKGWFADAELKNAFDFASILDEDTTLYAKWEEVKQVTPSSSSSSGRGGGSSSSPSKTSVDASKTPTQTTPATETTKATDAKSLEALTKEFAEANKSDAAKVEALAQALASVQQSALAQELKNAYTYAYLRGITTQPSIEKAELNRGLTRAEMAKMMSVFATQVLGKKAVKTDSVQYADVKMEGDLPGYIQLAYQLQIMGIDAKGNAIANFNPNVEVSRAEFATVLSRVLYGDKYNQEGADFASKHLSALKDADILKDTNPQMKELRGWVMLMLQRAEGVK